MASHRLNRAKILWQLVLAGLKAQLVHAGERTEGACEDQHGPSERELC